ncbi:hypothetical protein ACWEOE_35740 [Amycolatopsis sp. NPDC004368]
MSGHSVRRAAAAIVALLGVLTVVLACTNDQSGQPPASAPASPSTPSTTTSALRTECSAVATAAKNLATETASLVAGQASRDDVTTAARDLRASLDAARDVLGPEARSDLDVAGTSLQQLQDVLTTQPLDVTALRTAATQVATSAGAVVSVCGGTSTPATPATT